MKKIALFVLSFSLICISVSAQEKTDNQETQKKSSSEAWKSIGQDGEKLLKDTGKFFKNITKQAGESIKSGVNELTTIQCKGKWYYLTKNNVKTRIVVADDGTFTLIQKKGFESNWVDGVCTGTAHILNVRITNIGKKSFLKKEEKKMDANLLVTYSVSKDKNSCNFALSGINRLLDETDFTKGIDFVREE